jgi:hypothetical protein
MNVNVYVHINGDTLHTHTYIYIHTRGEDGTHVTRTSSSAIVFGVIPVYREAVHPYTCDYITDSLLIMIGGRN